MLLHALCQCLVAETTNTHGGQRVIDAGAWLPCATNHVYLRLKRCIACRGHAQGRMHACKQACSIRPMPIPPQMCNTRARPIPALPTHPATHPPRPTHPHNMHPPCHIHACTRTHMHTAACIPFHSHRSADDSDRMEQGLGLPQAPPPSSRPRQPGKHAGAYARWRGGATGLHKGLVHAMTCLCVCAGAPPGGRLAVGSTANGQWPSLTRLVAWGLRTHWSIPAMSTHIHTPTAGFRVM